MDGYKIDELYYLYRQGCPIAQKLLIEYCYWQIKMMLPAYCYTSSRYREDNSEYVQIIIVRCIQALEKYRPDRGTQVKSFMSMVIQNEISSLVVKKHGRVLREQQILYSLDDYYSDDRHIRYIDAIKDDRTPDLLVANKEQLERVNSYIEDSCSLFEKTVIDCHKMGLKDNDIALKLDKDVRSIYNANYRIQKKMEKSNLFD